MSITYKNIQTGTIVAQLLHLFMAIGVWMVYKIIRTHYDAILSLTASLE